MSRTTRKKNQDGSMKTKTVMMKFAAMTCAEPESKIIDRFKNERRSLSALIGIKGRHQ